MHVEKKILSSRVATDGALKSLLNIEYTYDYWYHAREYAPETHDCQPVLHFFALPRCREWISSSSSEEENTRSSWASTQMYKILKLC